MMTAVASSWPGSVSLERPKFTSQGPSSWQSQQLVWVRVQFIEVVVRSKPSAIGVQSRGHCISSVRRHAQVLGGSEHKLIRSF